MRNAVKAPFPDGFGYFRLFQVALDLVGVVVDFDVDEVGGVRSGVLEFREGFRLGSTGGGGAKAGEEKTTTAGLVCSMASSTLTR